MKRRKLTVLTIVLIIIGVSSCQKIREELIPTRIEGTVTDAETGEAIPYSTVYLIQFWATNGGGSEVYGTYYTNEKGEFKIREKLPIYVDKKGSYKPEFWYKVLGENKPLFYCGTINGKNTTRDPDASAGVKITKKNNFSLKLRKTGLLRMIAVDNPNINLRPLIIIYQNGGQISKYYPIGYQQENLLHEIYLLPNIYELKDGSSLVIPIDIIAQAKLDVNIEY